jgi:hypothetical protein
MLVAMLSAVPVAIVHEVVGLGPFAALVLSVASLTFFYWLLVPEETGFRARKN